MGSSQVTGVKRIKQDEIDKYASKNVFINQSFTRFKNSNGFVDLGGLYSITNGLVNEKILKKIIKICGSKKNQLLFDDFCYFYAIINTTDFTAKTNFLLDFIFLKEDKLPINKYKHKVEKYFNGSILLNEILLNPSLISNNQKIDRETVFNYIKSNYYDSLMNYNLYVNSTMTNNLTNNGKIVINSTNDSIINECESGEENNLLTLSNNYSKKVSINSTMNALYNIAPTRCQKFDYLSNEFSNIEKQNNGIFPIALFVDMLREINVNDVLIEVIENYLRKKTQKSFFNFDLFKEILSILIDDEPNKDENDKNQEIAKGIFTLIAYPNNYIDRNFLNKIAQKSNLNNPKLQKNISSLSKRIYLDKFLEIIDLFKSEFIESLEHINYLLNIFFSQELEKITLENNCIEILLKGNSLQDYIIDRMQKDDYFYLIDVAFWNKWNDITTNQNQEDEDDINNMRRNLKIRTKNICDKNGKILEGKEYIKDFIVVSKTIYTLFCQWYGRPSGVEIKREKIYLDDFKNKNSTITSSYASNYIRKKTRKNKIEDIFKGEDEITKKKFVLEVYPIFLIFFNYDELIKSSSIKDNKDIIKILKNSSNPENDRATYHPFSRKKKFSEIAKMLKGDANLRGDINSIRFWTFFQGDFRVVDEMEDSLEDRGLNDTAVIVIESKINNNWPSDEINKDTSNKSIKQKTYKVGLNNIGNTCYMNSVLQIFLNIEKLKSIFIKETPEENKYFLSFILNNSKEKYSGRLMREFINILKEKWIEGKKSISPNNFKEICGKINPIFQGDYQEDAHEFYSFLVDKLHEDSNIKTINYEIKNPDTVDTNEEDLGNECWANTVRNNASYIYGLFMGQMKSTLICSECNTKKIKYEPFSSIGLPIPESNNITIKIILFRLPYSLRKFKNDLNSENKINNDSTNVGSVYAQENDENSSNLNKKRKKSIQVLVDSTNDEQLKGSEMSIMNNTMKSKNEIINDVLNLNIPLKLSLEVNRTEKCNTIIDKLKCSSDLNLEKNSDYIEYIMISNEKFIDENLKIDETFPDGQTVYVYELLNYCGLRSIFNYKKIVSNNEKIYLLSEQKIKNIINPKQKLNLSKLNSSKLVASKQQKEEDKENKMNIFYSFIVDQQKLNEYDDYEILISIKHRVIKDINKGLIPYFNYSYFFNYQDFIILPSKQSIKPYDLYKMMWKKYRYFLNSPSNYENFVWWKKSNKEEKKNRGNKKASMFSSNCLKNFLPFTLKILNKNTNACAYCPWFRFCTGCIIDPNSSDFVEINRNNIIIIEWNKEIKKREIKNSNIDLVLTHPSLNEKEENESNNEEDRKVTIDDCFKLFTKKEELKDVLCEKCKKKTLFTKILEIDRLPEYLVLVFKRFKLTATDTIKINKVINFPLENLNLKNYTSQKENIPKYNLFGIINHSGTLERGHYTSIFNNNGIWNKYDDSNVSENNNNLETSSVYMLVYQSIKQNKKSFRFNFIGLMDRAYCEFTKKLNFAHVFNYDVDSKNKILNEYPDDCKFYYGEPVIIDGNRGYLVNVEKEEGVDLYKVKIKLQKGDFTGVVTEEKIIKETYKKFEGLKKSSLDNYSVSTISDKKSDKKKDKRNSRTTTECSDNCVIY